MLRSLGVAAAAAAAAAVMVPALALLLPRWLQALALSFGHVLLGLPRVAEVDGGGGASGSFPPPHSFFSRSVGDTTMALSAFLAAAAGQARARGQKTGPF